MGDGFGSFYEADDNKYEGFLENDNANGWGQLIHSDGDVYEGEWKESPVFGIIDMHFKVLNRDFYLLNR